MKITVDPEKQEVVACATRYPFAFFQALAQAAVGEGFLVRRGGDIVSITKARESRVMWPDMDSLQAFDPAFLRLLSAEDLRRCNHVASMQGARAADALCCNIIHCKREERAA